MLYVIIVDDGSYAGQYVALPGSQCSYTRKLQEARTYPNRKAAEYNACGNEHVEER